MTNLRTIQLADIHIPKRLREVDNDHVLALSMSILNDGLLNPVTVRSTPNGKAKFTLIAGAHRLRAVAICDEKEIDCLIIKADQDQAILLEISENLFRHDLSALDRVIFVQTYRDVWEKKYGKIMRGGDQSANIALCLVDKIQEEASKGFSSVCAEKLGMSKRSVQLATRISQNLTPAVRKSVQGTEIANNQTQLLKLSSLEPDEQKKAATAIVKTKGDYKQAMDLLKGICDVKADPQMVLLDRLVDTWSRADEMTKNKFLKFLETSNKDEVT